MMSKIICFGPIVRSKKMKGFLDDLVSTRTQWLNLQFVTPSPETIYVLLYLDIVFLGWSES